MEKNVHTEHCCERHGCKYGDSNCPVANGIQKQSYDCEACDWDMNDNNDLVQLMKWLANKDYITDSWEQIYKEYLYHGN